MFRNIWRDKQSLSSREKVKFLPQNRFCGQRLSMFGIIFLFSAKMALNFREQTEKKLPFTHWVINVGHRCLAVLNFAIVFVWKFSFVLWWLSSCFHDQIIDEGCLCYYAREFVQYFRPSIWSNEKRERLRERKKYKTETGLVTGKQNGK